MRAPQRAMTRLSTPLIALLITTTSASAAVPRDTKSLSAREGSSGRGGGDSISDRMRKIREWLGKDGREIRYPLEHAAKNVAKFQAQGEISAELKRAVAGGLIEDIKNAPYDFEEQCFDQDGIEHSASTEDVDLTGQVDPVRPAICVSIRKLAEDNARYEEVVGNLMHEHTRHFGIKDTDRLGFSPIADFISERLELLTNPALDQASSELDGTMAYFRNDLSGRLTVFVTSAYPATVISVADVVGTCRDVYFQEFFDSRPGNTTKNMTATPKISIYPRRISDEVGEKSLHAVMFREPNFSLAAGPSKCEFHFTIDTGSQTFVVPELTKIPHAYGDLGVFVIFADLADPR